MDTSETILECFLEGKYTRLQCPQCENTFLTNVYTLDCRDTTQSLNLNCTRCQKAFAADTRSEAWKYYVLLEKYALGLEYFCDAVQTQGLTQIPFIRRVGILDEADQILEPDRVRLFQTEEPDYRIIYVMERLQHLEQEESDFFTEYLHDIDWLSDADRQRIWSLVSERYGAPLAEDLRQLCRYYRLHSDYVEWDLHGDNLMRRIRDGRIVVMDPFIPRTA